jgi:zinc D-Ala-D-Ala dipeptidase
MCFPVKLVAKIILVIPLLQAPAYLSGQTIPVKRNPYNLNLIVSIEAYRKQLDRDQRNRMVDLEKAVTGIRTDIRYATTNNFTKEIMYSGARAFARKPVADALRKVQDSLAFHKAGLKIYDAYRPYAVTLRFYEVSPNTRFVANPAYGSVHNRGCAVDLTLVELQTGTELPMPTPFDDFSSKAGMAYTNLSDTILANRKLLSGVMTYFGFEQNSAEWWHFDFTGWKNFNLMDLTFDELDKALRPDDN